MRGRAEEELRRHAHEDRARGHRARGREPEPRRAALAARAGAGLLQQHGLVEEGVVRARPGRELSEPPRCIPELVLHDAE